MTKLFSESDINKTVPQLSGTHLTSAKSMSILLAQKCPNNTKSKTATKDHILKNLMQGVRKEGLIKGNGWCAGHLLNHELGGVEQVSNLTILTEGGNGCSANQKHSGKEELIKEALRAAYSVSLDTKKKYIPCIFYQVKVILNNDTNTCKDVFGETKSSYRCLKDLHPSIPMGIQIEAYPVLVVRNKFEDQVARDKKNIVLCNDLTSFRTLEKEFPTWSEYDMNAYLRCTIEKVLIPNAVKKDHLHPKTYSTNSTVVSTSSTTGITKPSKTKYKRKTKPSQIANYLSNSGSSTSPPRVANLSKWLKKR